MFRPNTFAILWHEDINASLNHLQELAQPYIVGDIFTVLEPALHSLYQRLEHLAAKCCILTLHEVREAGALQGKDSTERFADFIAKLSSAELFQLLQERYPLLFKQANQIISRFKNFISIFFERFGQDRVLLSRFSVNQTLPYLKSLETDLGDSHDNGQSVLKLSLACGSKLFYKPRSLVVEEKLNQLLLDWANSIPAWPKLSLPQQLARKDYGWQPEVVYQPCLSSADYQTYYQSLGYWLGLSYWLGSTDLHYDNLIVSQARPQFIDGETLLHPLQTPVHDWTVMQTMILPHIAFSNGKKPGIDLSALGYQGIGVWPEPKEVIVDHFTDKAQIGFAYHPLKTASNLASPGHQTTKTNERILIQSFRTMIKLIQNNIQRLQSTLQESLCGQQVPLRVILRPTHTYNRLLIHSNHPQLLKSIEARENYFAQISRSRYCQPQHVVAAEIKALLQGDIPKFTVFADSQDLYQQNELIQANFFAHSALQAVQTRQRFQWHKADLQVQINLIKQSFAVQRMHQSPKTIKRSTTKRANPWQVQAQSNIKKLWRELNKNILLRAQELQIWGPVCLNLQDWTVQRQAEDFYAGHAGIMLTNAALGSQLKVKDALHIAQLSYKQLLTRLGSTDCPKLKLGYSGWAGLLRAAELVESWLGLKPELSQAVIEYLTNNFAKLAQSGDFLDGVAGLIVALNKSIHQTATQPLLIQSYAWLQHHYDANLHWWPDKYFPTPILGLSHGYSGYALAYGIIAKKLNVPTALAFAKQLLAYEDQHFDPKTQSWPDRRQALNNQNHPNTVDAWCHGAAGITLARVSLYELNQDISLLHLVEKALPTLLRSANSPNPSYCHGNAGRLEAIYVAKTHFPGLINETRWQNLAKDYVTNAASALNSLPGELIAPGFMLGSSGVIYQLLRLLFPRQIPCVII